MKALMIYVYKAMAGWCFLCVIAIIFAGKDLNFRTNSKIHS